MRTFNSILLILAAIVVLSSCNKESDLADALSAEDEVATEGMEAAYGEAKLYNDSLIWCVDTNLACTNDFTAYCDSIFHASDSLYMMHHEDYSHNNMSDDHHHSNVNGHEHGMVEDHEEDPDGDHYEHSIETLEQMQQLRADHTAYHPG